MEPGPKDGSWLANVTWSRASGKNRIECLRRL